MSLINDALKRAKQAQRRHAPPVTTGVPMRPAETTPRLGSASGLVWLVAGALLFGVAAVILIFVAARGSAAKDRELAASSHKEAISPPSASAVPARAPVSAATTQPTKPNLAESGPTPKPVPKAPTQATPRIPNAIVPTTPRPGGPARTPAPLPNAPLTPPSPQPLAATTLPNVNPSVPSQPATASLAADVSTVAASPPTPTKPKLPKLQGIFYRPDRPSAVLNGKTVFVGGSSGEYRVTAISQQAVTVTRAGATNILSLEE